MSAWNRSRDWFLRREGKVWLIDCGECPAKPAADLVPGDVRMFNYGSSAVVTNVAPATRCFINVTCRTSDGHEYTQRLKATRLVPVRITR